VIVGDGSSGDDGGGVKSRAAWAVEAESASSVDAELKVASKQGRH
jgi:hypothetical protein